MSTKKPLPATQSTEGFSQASWNDSAKSEMNMPGPSISEQGTEYSTGYEPFFLD
jgi:hypothetical protein